MKAVSTRWAGKELLVSSADFCSNASIGEDDPLGFGQLHLRACYPTASATARTSESTRTSFMEIN